ncbi:LDL receptor wingless signaling/trafficking chaperone [Wolffia australiana]
MVVKFLLFLFFFAFFFLHALQGKRVTIPDELEDVVDDEEDDAWKEWGKKKRVDERSLPPPPDLSKMELSEIQEEMMKHHVGPSFGFVKLRPGAARSPDDVPEIAMRWTKVLRTGSIEAKFMAVDINTIMFTLEKGQDTQELKEFILSQQEAYEIKIGENKFRRPGDPSLDDLLDRRRRGDEL